MQIIGNVIQLLLRKVASNYKLLLIFNKLRNPDADVDFKLVLIDFWSLGGSRGKLHLPTNLCYREILKITISSFLGLWKRST